MKVTSEQWIRNMTRRIFVYWDTPKDQRTRTRQLHRQTQLPWPVRWFGLFGFFVIWWWKRRKR